MENTSNIITQVTYRNTERPRYQGLDTEALIAELAKAGIGNGHQMIRSKSVTNTKHCARINMGEEETLFDTKVRPQLVLWNSYNGECSFRASLGFFRFVCANGMTIGTDMTTVKLRHVVGQKWDTSLAKFVEDLKRLSETGLTEVLAPMETKLNGTQVRLILREIQARGVISERLFKHVERGFIVNSWRYEDRTGRLWDLWNVLNEQMRRASRSQVRFEERNDRLFSQVLETASRFAA